MLYREVESKIKEHDALLAENTQQIEVLKPKIDSLGSGSPKGAFATLSALQSDVNANTVEGKKYIYVVTTDGGWYYWNGTTWTKGGVYQATGIVDRSITQEKLSQGLISLYYLNLFDSRKATDGVALGELGNTWVYETYFTTDFIDVKAGQTIYANFNGRLNLYDKNKNFVSTHLNVLEVTAIQDGYFRKCTDIVNKETLMLMFQPLPTSYVQFDYPIINPSKVNGFMDLENEVAVNSEVLSNISVKLTQNLYNKDDRTNVNGHAFSASLDGTYFTSALYEVSHYIPVSYGKTYIYNLTSEIKRIIFYDVNKVVLSGVVAGSGNLITPPENTAFVRFHYFVDSKAKIMFVEGSTLPSQYIPHYEVKITNKDVAFKDDLDVLKSKQWINKKWVSYGDSTVYMGMWQTSVSKELGLVHTNRGIGGSTIVESNKTAYLNADGSLNSFPQEGVEQPAGTILIRSSFCNQERIDAQIPTDAKLITILGGINDYIGQYAIGNIDDIYTLNEATFYGGYASVIKKIRTRCPNARIVLMTPNTISDNTKTIKFYKYVKAIYEIGMETGCPVVDIYGESGINRQQITTFTSDGIHPNIAGGNKMSEVVISRVKNIMPI